MPASPSSTLPETPATTVVATTTIPPAAPVTVLGATSFDPFGEGGESDTLIPNLFDDDSSTVWRTERYQDPLPLLKPGVGFRVEIEGEPSRVELFGLSPGTDFELFWSEQRRRRPRRLGTNCRGASPPGNHFCRPPGADGRLLAGLARRPPPAVRRHLFLIHRRSTLHRVTTPGTETDLLVRVISGDRAAFDSIMRTQEDRVFSVCLRILGDRDNALDATQETFLTVFRKASQFKGDSALGTWIYRIAVNTCYDQIRKSARKPTESLPDHLEPLDASAEDAIDAAGLRPEIERALAALPIEFRAAVVLSDLEGHVVARGGGDTRCPRRDREIAGVPRAQAPRRAPGEPKSPMRPSKRHGCMTTTST